MINSDWLDLFEIVSKIDESIVDRFIDEDDELSEDDKIILKWALQKGIIPESFPKYNAMMDELIKLPSVERVPLKDVDWNKVADRTDVSQIYLRKVLLPAAEKAWKNKDITPAHLKKAEPTIDKWIDTVWKLTTHVLVVRKGGKEHGEFHKDDIFYIEDVKEREGKKIVVAMCQESWNPEIEGAMITMTPNRWLSNFDIVEE